MFPSNNSLHNPFFSSPSSSSSPYVDLSPFIIHHQDPNQIQNQNQNQNPLSFSPTTISNNAVMCSSNGEFGNEYGFGEKRRPPKKDRHSKIYTAQGLRDRRVRMSIDIARKFFDLQDLLGFDKASKTLEWLLTKSQNAILQLSINSKTASSCEQENGDNMNSKDEKKMKKMKKKAAEASNAKELREKARARARERTRLKMLLSTAKSNDSNLLINHLHQQSSSVNCYVRPCHQEPEFVKKKPMMAYQQNLILFKDSNFNNNSSSNKNFPNLHLSSDSNSAAARSTVCAINTMRRSAGTYLWDKLWD